MGSEHPNESTTGWGQSIRRMTPRLGLVTSPAPRGELQELLSRPTVEEILHLRSPRLGFMAFHGGRLEKVTDVVATEAAARSGASYYLSLIHI